MKLFKQTDDKTLLMVAELPFNYSDLDAQTLYEQLVDNANLRNDIFKALPKKPRPTEYATTKSFQKVHSMLMRYPHEKTDSLLKSVPLRVRNQFPTSYAGSGEFCVLEFKFDQ